MKPNCQTCIYPRLYRAHKALREATSPHDFHDRLRLKDEIKRLESQVGTDSLGRPQESVGTDSLGRPLQNAEITGHLA